MGLFDKNKSSLLKGNKLNLTCPCPDTCCDENPANDPTPPTNCTWILFWDLFDDGGVTPIQSGSNHVPNASSSISRDLGSLPLGSDYMIRVTVETIISAVPAGIQYNALNVAGDFSSIDVNNTPIVSPILSTQIIGEVTLDGSAGPHQTTIGVTSECQNLDFVFDYEIV